MSELTIDYDFSLQHCPTCSLPFMLPELDLKNRQDTGRSFFCPSGHEIKATPKGQLASLQWQLEQALNLAAEEQVKRFDAESELQRILEEAEAPGELENAKPEASERVVQTTVQPVDWRDTEEKKCPECHTVFKPQPSHNPYSWGKKKFCSQVCLVAANSRKAKEKPNAVKEAASQTDATSGLDVPLAAPKAANSKKPERQEPQHNPSTQGASS